MSRPAEDLTGRRFGSLLVLSQERKEYKGKRQSVCLCRCDCGVEKEFPASALCRADGSPAKRGIRSCGHTRVIGDITGQRFGRLTALEQMPERNTAGEVVWRCRCDCGNEKSVSASQLRSGYVTSCGCAALERSRMAAGLGGKASHAPEAEAKRQRTMFGDPGSEARKAAGERLKQELKNTGAIVRGMHIAKLAQEQPESTNPYRGVCWSSAKKKWMAYCQVGKKRWSSAVFRTPEEAKEARDKRLLLMLEEHDAENAVADWKRKNEKRDHKA